MLQAGFSASRRFIAADNAAERLKSRADAEVCAVSSVFFYLFFCGELDSSASGSHDGFIRGLQPLSCFSL